MKSAYKKYFGESILIIFSVLFALFIDQQVVNWQIAKKKRVALESIRQELYRNQAIVSTWKAKHIAIRDRIGSVLDGENDSLKVALQAEKYLNLYLLTNNESLIDALLTDTAWESAQSTGIVSEFDFETTQKLTHVYSMQDIMLDKTLMKITDYYFDSSSHDMDKLEQILIQFQLRFWELTGQELLMEDLYSKAIEHLNTKRI